MAAGASVFRRKAWLRAGGYEPRFFLGGEEALLAFDLVAQGWALVYVADLTVYHYPSPQRDARARRRLLTRNALWVAWLRRPFGSACKETLRLLRAARAEGALSVDGWAALRGLPWALHHRRVLPASVEALRRQLEPE